MEKQKLVSLRNIIEIIKDKGVSEEVFIDLDLILNENNVPLVFDSLSLNAASFSPTYKRIIVNMKRVVKWAEEMMQPYSTYMRIGDKELLKAYLILYMLAHEVEHSKQFLTGRGFIKPDYDYKQPMYNDLFDVLTPKRYMIPRPISLGIDTARFIKYKKNAYNYILERNASINGYDLAMRIAEEVGDEEIYNCMVTSRNVYYLQGYATDGTGSLKTTYKGLWLMKKYKELVFPDMPLLEKAKEGLELDNAERGKVLAYIKKSSKFRE